MNRQCIRIFWIIQATGAVFYLGAYFIQDPLLWLGSLLVLLPGSLLGWLQLFAQLHRTNDWSLLTVGLIANAVNVFLFVLTASLLGKRQRFM